MTGGKGGLSGFTVLVAGDDVTMVFLSDITDNNDSKMGMGYFPTGS
jgi:hypothetical protein